MRETKTVRISSSGFPVHALYSPDTDENAVEAVEVQSVLYWSVFIDEDSANLLRKFLKEHAD